MYRAKSRLGEWAASRIGEELRLGIGSGSTVDAFIGALKRWEEVVRRSRCCTAASLESEHQARQAGLIVKPLKDFSELDLVVDGADTVGREGTLIKGGGVALVPERLLIAAAKRVQILVDASKRRTFFRRRGSVWLEAGQRGGGPQADWVELRTQAGKPQLDAPQSLHQNLKQLAGLVDSGIFFGYAPEIWMSDGESV